MKAAALLGLALLPTLWAPLDAPARETDVPAPAPRDESGPEAGPAREVRRSFELTIAEAGPSASPWNCVVVASEGTTRIERGSIAVRPRHFAFVGAQDLGFVANRGSWHAQGRLPLTLDVTAVEIAGEHGAVISLRPVEGAAAGRVQLDVSLSLRGSDPSFALAGCGLG